MTMSPEEVRAAVKAKGTKFASVTFTKKNGDLRTINGLFRAYKHVKGTGRATPDHLVAIWSPKDGWRSFDVHSVHEVR